MSLLNSCFVTKELNKFLTCHAHVKFKVLVLKVVSWDALRPQFQKYVFLGSSDNSGIVKISKSAKSSSYSFMNSLSTCLHAPQRLHLNLKSQKSRMIIIHIHLQDDLGQQDSLRRGAQV